MGLYRLLSQEMQCSTVCIATNNRKRQATGQATVERPIDRIFELIDYICSF